MDNQNISASPSKPLLPGVGVLLRRTKDLYVSQFTTIAEILILPTLLLIVLVYIFTGNNASGQTLYMRAAENGGGIAMLLLMFILLIMVIVAQIWAQITLLYAVVYHGEILSVTALYKRAWHTILSYGWLSITMGLIVFGGYALFIIPGIIFTVWFSMAYFVFVDEGLKGMNALLRSRDYVRGHWFGVLWRLICVIILSGLVSFIIGTGVSILKLPYGPEISKILIGIVVSPFMVIYSYTLYTHLKTEKGAITYQSNKIYKIGFIVTAILGMLIIPVTVILISLGSVNKNEMLIRDSERTSKLNRIKAMVKIYRTDNGHYPSTLDDLVPIYTQRMTIDENVKKEYRYESDGANYFKVCTTMEATKDSCVMGD